MTHISDVFRRCNIDFLPSPAIHTGQNVMFHLSLRPYENAIIRNHLENGRWGHEERYGKYKVRARETFEIFILADHEFYKIAYNGEHIGVFRHRLPLHLVNYIQVSGDCKIDHVLYEQDVSTAAAVQGQVIVSQMTSSTSSYGGGVRTTTTTVPSAPLYPTIPVAAPTPMNVYVMQPAQPPSAYQPPGTVSEFVGLSAIKLATTVKLNFQSTLLKIGGIALEKQQGGFAIKKEKKDLFKF